MSTNTGAPNYPLVYREEPYIRVAVVYNPFDLSDITVAQLVYDQDKTLADYMEGLPEEVAWIIGYNGEAVERDQWASIKPAAFSTISLVRAPEGGRNTKQVLRIIALIAVAVVAHFVAGPIGDALVAGSAPAWLTAAVATTITAVGSTLVNALIPPNAGMKADKEESPSYGINGPKNTAREGIPVPVVYGEYRLGGNICDIFTKTYGDKQYLFMRTVLNDGPVFSISDIEINDQPLSAFSDVITRISQGGDPAENNDWFDEAINLYNRNTKLTSAWTTHQTTGPVDRLRADILFPYGLYFAKDDGRKVEQQVTLEIEVRPIDADGEPLGDWEPMSLTDGTPIGIEPGETEFSVPTADYLQLEVATAALAEGREDYQVEVLYRRAGESTWNTGTTLQGLAEKSSTTGLTTPTLNFPTVTTVVQLPETGDWDIKVNGGSVINVIRNPSASMSLLVKDTTTQPKRVTYESGRLERSRYELRMRRTVDSETGTKSYTESWLSDVGEIDIENVNLNGIANLSLMIKVGEQISGIPKVTALVKGSLVKIRDEEGNVIEEAWTDNPADIAMDILHNPIRGGGYPLYRSVWSRVVEFREFCEANSYKFNGVYDTFGSLWDAAQSAAKVGHGTLVPRGTKLTFAIDGPAEPQMIFGPGNIFADSFHKSWMGLTDRANEIQLAFSDRHDSFKQKTIRITDNEAISRGQKLKIARLQSFGITDAAQAKAEAEYMARSNRYIRQFVEFDAPLEAIGINVGEVALIEHDSINFADGASGRLASGSTDTVINLDRPLHMTAGKDYSLLVIHDAVERATSTVVSKSGDRLTLSGLATLPGRVSRLVTDSVDVEVVKVFEPAGGNRIVTVDDASDISVGDEVTLWDTDVIEERDIVLDPGDQSTITLTEPLSMAPGEFTNFMAGYKESVRKPFRLRKISGSGYDRRTLSMVQYDERVYEPGAFGTVTIDAPPRPVLEHVGNLRLDYERAPSPTQERVQATATWSRPVNMRYAGADIWFADIDDKWVFAQSVQNVDSFSRDVSRDSLIKVKVVAFDIYGNRVRFSDAPVATLQVDIGALSLLPPEDLAYTVPYFRTDATASLSWTPGDNDFSTDFRIDYKSLTEADYEALVAASDPEDYPSSVTAESGYKQSVVTAYNNATIQQLDEGFFVARVRAEKGFQSSPWVYLPIEVAAPALDAPTGLRLNGGTPEVASDTFIGQDASWTWDDIITQAAAIGGSNVINLPWQVQDYQVRILTTAGVEIRKEFTASPSYAYTFSKNAEDSASIGGGVIARRSFKIEVRARGVAGQLSDAAVMEVSNAAPDLAVADPHAGIEFWQLNITPPNVADYAGIIVWASTTSGFTPNDSLIVWQASGNPTIAGTGGTTYYYRYALYDTFGPVDLNISPQASITPSTATTGTGSSDTTPPDVPTGLALSSSIALDTDGSQIVTLVATWSGVGNSDLNFYELALQQGAGPFVVTATQGSRLEWRVPANTAYTAKVRAVDTSGNRSSYTSTVSHTSTQDTTAPAAPSSVAAAASFNGVFLTWTNPTASDLDSVEVWTNTVNNSGTATKLTTVSALSAAPGAYTHSGLATGTARYYWLKAVDRSGNTSGFSSGVTATPGKINASDFDTTAPSVPAGLALSSSLTVDTDGSQIITLAASWSANADSDFDHYEIALQEGSGSFSEFTAGTQLNMTWVAKGNTAYTAKIRAVDKTGNRSAYSTTVTHTTTKDTTAPSAPSAFTVSPGIGALYLAWTNPTAADLSSVEVWENTTNNSGTATKIATVQAKSAAPGTYSRTGLGSNATRYYWLKAVDTSGNASVFSSVANAATVLIGAGDFDTVAPAVPTGLALSSAAFLDTDGSQIITLTATWTGVSDTDLASYVIALQEGSGAFTEFNAGTATNYVWRVKANVSYTAKVLAADKTGNRSAFTATVSHTATRDTTAPSAPTSVTATAGVTSIFVGWTNPSDADLSKIEIWANTVNNSGTATKIGTVGAQASAPQVFVHGGLATGATRYYWLKAVDTSGNTSGFTSVANATVASVGTADIAANAVTATQIAAGTITATQIAAATITGALIAATTITAANIAAGTITATQIAAGTITASQIAAGTITGALISTSTSLPGTITVGSTGVQIGTVESRAADPLARANALNTTTLAPGLVLISGSTTLANWRDGTDATKITGGAIAANTVQANSLTIGSRGIDIAGLEFRHNWNGSAITADTLAWTAGTISYVDNAGSPATASITAGSVAWTAGTTYVYWDTASPTVLQTTTSQATAYGATKIILATYRGGTNLVANYGRTIVDGSKITTGSVTAAQIAAGTITAAEIAASTITGAKIAANTITAGNIQAGTITATEIAAATITGSRIAAGTITAGNIAAGTITATEIALGTVTASQIANATITGSKIAGTTITAGNIATGTITANEIAAGTITATQIAAGTITGSLIAADTITASKLSIGARGINTSGLEFRANWNGTAITTNTLYWSAGTISYVDDSGAASTAAVTAGSVAWTAGTIYVYWAKGATSLSTTTTLATAYASGNIVVATYRGAVDLVATYGRTWIDGSIIQTGTLYADRLVAGTITTNEIAVNGVATSNIAANAVTNTVTAYSASALNGGTPNTGNVNVQTVTIPPASAATPGRMDINFDCSVLWPNTATHVYLALSALYTDATTSAVTIVELRRLHIRNDGQRLDTICLSYTDTPPANVSSVQYVVERVTGTLNSPGTTGNCDFEYRSMKVTELKR